MYLDEINVGEILKLARLEFKYSLEKVSLESGISISTIKNYERDIVKYKLINIVKLCKVYNLDVKDLGIKKICKNEQIKLDEKDFIIISAFEKDEEIIYEIKNEKGHYFIDNYKYLYKTLNINKYPVFIQNMYSNRILKRNTSLGFNSNNIISIDEYFNLITRKCYYCGEESSQEKIINKKMFRHNGIDRIDSNKGYIKGNVVSCCTDCNLMKGTLDQSKFLNKIKQINEYQKRA